MSRKDLFYLCSLLFCLLLLSMSLSSFWNKSNDKDRVRKNTTVGQGDPECIYRDYVKFVKTIDTRCRAKKRFGGRDDSGYDVCTDDFYSPRKPCLVYSFGSKFSFGFENDVIKNAGCETHTFDPSEPIAGHRIPKGIKFHLIGLSDADYTNNLGWPMKSLSSLRQALNHTSTIIDVLKIDIEGYEWKALPQILATVPLKYIKQLLIELHFGREKKGMSRDGYITLKSNFWGHVDIFTQFNILKQLYDYGFRVFSYSENPRSKIKSSDSFGIITCYVVSMININDVS